MPIKFSAMDVCVCILCVPCTWYMYIIVLRFFGQKINKKMRNVNVNCFFERGVRFVHRRLNLSANLCIIPFWLVWSDVNSFIHFFFRPRTNWCICTEISFIHRVRTRFSKMWLLSLCIWIAVAFCWMTTPNFFRFGSYPHGIVKSADNESTNRDTRVRCRLDRLSALFRRADSSNREWTPTKTDARDPATGIDIESVVRIEPLYVFATFSPGSAQRLRSIGNIWHGHCQPVWSALNLFTDVKRCFYSNCWHAFGQQDPAPNVEVRVFLGLGRTKKVCVANATDLNTPVSEVTQFLSDNEMLAVGLTVACDDFEKMPVFLMVRPLAKFVMAGHWFQSVVMSRTWPDLYQWNWPPSFLVSWKVVIGVHRPLVISHFVSLLASLRIWSSKIIGDIGVDDDMTQYVLLEGYGTSTNLNITFLHRTPKSCEPATQEGSTSGFHTQASCPLWGTYADKFSFSEEGLTFGSPMWKRWWTQIVAQPFAECVQKLLARQDSSFSFVCAL